jgi:hypothetical protein
MSRDTFKDADPREVSDQDRKLAEPSPIHDNFEPHFQRDEPNQLPWDG